MRQRITGSALGIIALLGLAAPAVAQTMSADDIIRSLKPMSAGGPTRGIRVIPQAGGTAPEPVQRRGAVARAEPAARADAATRADPAVDLTVNFVSGSADLAAGAKRTLDQLGKALTSRDLASFRFRIEGHTDTVGGADMNKALSERRATAVVDYLVTTWKIDRAKVEAVGLGETSLRVPTGPGVSQPMNRRVTVVNLGA